MLRARREARQNGQQPPAGGAYGGRLGARRGYGAPQDQYDPYQQQQFGGPPQGYGGPQGYGAPQDQYDPYQQQQQYSGPSEGVDAPQAPQGYGRYHRYGGRFGQPQQQQYPQQQYGPPQPQQLPPQQYDPYGGAPTPYGAQQDVYDDGQQDVYAPEPLPQLPDYQSSKPRPCVVPQVGHKRFSDENMSPFVRIRVPELEQTYGISHHEWIVFLDEFNEAWMANPALQVANQAGNLAGMAPSLIAQIVGVGVNVGASIGSAVTTKVRTKKYLEKANKEVFHPKGLHVQVCKTEKMLEYAGLSEQDNVFSRYTQAFNYTQMNAPMNAQMTQGNNNPTMQRMSSLGNRVMSITFNNVERPTKPDNWIKKWGAHEAQKAEEKQNDKNARDQRRAGRRAGRGSSRREERNEKKKEKETKKIRWLVIAPKEQVSGDDDLGSDSEKSDK